MSPYQCQCGKECAWDPDFVGTTCGDLTVKGAYVCACGNAYLSKESHDAESLNWKVTGRSVTAGKWRIRVEGPEEGRQELLERIARLPQLELANGGAR